MTTETDTESDGNERVVKFLFKLTKGSKGLLNLDVARAAFALMPGWTIQDVCAPFDVSKSYDARDYLHSQIPGSRYVHRDYDENKHKELKTLHMAFEAAEAVEPGMARLKADFTIVAKMPTEVTPNTVYITKVDTVRLRSTDFPCVALGNVWIGVPGWKLTAPDGSSTVVLAPISRRGSARGPIFEVLAGFWTFVYKHGVGADAKKGLDALGSDIVEQALMTKAERDRVLAARAHLPEVAKVFEEITDRRFQAVVAYLTAMHIRGAEHYVKLCAEKSPLLKEMQLPSQQLISYDYETRVYVLKPDYKEAAAKLAHQQAEAARQQFIFKNTTRISMIAKRKNTVPVATLLSETGEGIAGYGGEVRFVFKDGSTFVLRNKTIWKTSSGGVYFAQFPTTFHEVLMPDGTPMEAPLSEERMQDVFSAV